MTPGEKSPVTLTDRESDVLDRLAIGDSNKGIAEFLGISEHTAKFHVTAITRKLRTQTRVQAVVRALQLGLIALSSIEIPQTEAMVTMGSGGKYFKRAGPRVAQ